MPFSDNLKRRIVVLAITVFLIGGFLGAKFDTKVAALFRDEQVPAGYLDRIEILSRFQPQGSIDFIGDSHVERGLWREMTGLDIANYGVGGDGVEGVASRIGASNASHIILLIGINDLIGGRSAVEVADSILQLIDETDREFLLIEIMPVSGRYGTHNKSIVATNELLQQGCESRCTFVRTWPSLVEGATLNRTFSRDGLHLNAEGYAALSSIVRKSVLRSVSQN